MFGEPRIEESMSHPPGSGEAQNDPGTTPDGAATEALLAEGLRLYEQAEAAGASLRFIGSLAVQLTCPQWKHLATDLGRRRSIDIDFVGYSKEQNRLTAVFTEAGFQIHPSVRHSQEYGVKRLIFEPPGHHPKVDVFLDDLIMAHTVSFAGRLGMSAPTVSLVDLLLSKLQIHEMTRNDLVDLVILLTEHEVGRAGAAIDGDHVGRVMGRDWGFFHTASTNLAALESALDGFAQLPNESATRVRTQIERLRRILAESPKSSRWKMRARVGTRVRWYEEVSEVT
jgi:hypothetical protein